MPESAAASRISALLALLLALSGPAQALEWKRIVPNGQVALRDARDLSIGPDDVLYVADTGNQRIIALDSNGVLLHEAGGFGGGNGQFRNPEDVAAEWGSSIWVLDYGNRRLQRFSRTLSWQASHDFRTDPATESARPAAIALTPAADLIVYDRDGQALLRYDPGFSLQARFDGTQGYIGDVEAIVFVRGAGLFWGERGAERLRRTDAMLNPLPDILLPDVRRELILCAADSTLLFSEGTMIQRWPDASTPAETVVDLSAIAELKDFRGSAMAVNSVGAVFVLDRMTGDLVRVSP